MTTYQRHIMLLCFRFLIKDASQCKENRQYLIEHLAKILKISLDK